MIASDRRAGLQLRVRNENLIFLFLNQTYVVGTQKNRQFYPEIFCLSKPMGEYLSDGWMVKRCLVTFKTKVLERYLVCTISPERMDGFEPNLHRHMTERWKINQILVALT